MSEHDKLVVLRATFLQAAHESMNEIGLSDPKVENYLADLLVAFLHQDGMYAIRDRHGRPVTNLAAMLAEGDIRLNASSFERERQVHKHIGDFLLFWSGMFPNGYRSMDLTDRLIDLDVQAMTSYRIAGSFDHPPFTEEAPVLLKLSEEFEGYRYGLRQIGKMVA